MMDMNALTPRSEDTRLERIEKHLLRARAYLPARDDFLVKRAQQIRNKDAKKRGIDPPEDLITLHLTGGSKWSFYEFMEFKEYQMAWDELEWAYQRYCAMRRIGGGKDEWPDPDDIGASRTVFWHAMASAAREMMHDSERPAWAW